MAEQTTEYEAVAWGALKSGDRVRVTHEAGDVGIGDVVTHGAHSTSVLALSMHASVFSYLTLDQWEQAGWTVERALTLLPTEPGVYIGKRLAHMPHVAAIFKLNGDGWNDESHARAVARDGLVRLVPVTEAQEEARLAAIREVDSHYPGGNNYIRNTWREAFEELA